ncbi:MAG: glucose-1-phosphate adenylyltransferase [Chloroflexi bacterium CG_4_9_14_3_um_filter_45_9]|nr:MAG: glucose-1-phosphate adenylyltransferase [Dehalococcoidia bacterium CG2_30_46_9]PIU23064.1 MAG: glucose-1-phosphate adenylyltransferase [Chloroflexi bacterium CG08_land_8_20_14_0_20_45_12]PIX27757.1 MAG: glucose-1-phosphate adenylyltransferase [Chloroflexi bacterium CG_4_8_14_3_um_filter_45_15]PJB51167.1 MAG: glucose-1-phosphate adenylyltransferase [Chloroflexi bacterium CG_4_9_14_3_um_filter_45_9]
MDKVLAIIMAGGAGERLQPLTRERSKAAVPFGGKFRLIDFTLSNCVNSGLRQVFVLTQYRSESLHRHIQEGWGISAAGLGDFIYCVPAQQKLGVEWYRGTADAVRQNLNLLTRKDVENILILSGDHVYKMNYLQFVAYHRAKKANLTVSAVRARKEQAIGKLGVLEIDEGHRLVGFEEKPAQPKTMPDTPDYALASMGVYIFKLGTLLQALQGQEEDFGKHIIPGMIGKHHDIFVYDYEEENKIEDFTVEVKDGVREKILVDKARDSFYWKDVGTIDSYYEASMDLVAVDPFFNLYGERWPFRTYQRPLPPSKCVLGGKTPESVVCDGCIISGGTVWKSILSPGVIVERDALVEQSVIFDDVVIEPGARVRRAIVDKESRIRAGALIGYDTEADKKRGCTISDNGIVVVPKRMDISRSGPQLF